MSEDQENQEKSEESQESEESEFEEKEQDSEEDFEESPLENEITDEFTPEPVSILPSSAPVLHSDQEAPVQNLEQDLGLEQTSNQEEAEETRVAYAENAPQYETTGYETQMQEQRQQRSEPGTPIIPRGVAMHAEPTNQIGREVNVGAWAREHGAMSNIGQIASDKERDYRPVHTPEQDTEARRGLGRKRAF
jgi:hypothetical protein